MAKLPIKTLPTKVMSARVPFDVYDAWQSLAKNNNKSVSECLRDAVTMLDKPILKNDDRTSLPDELSSILAAMGGGTVVGILLYKSIRSGLSNSKSLDMSINDIEVISGMLAVAGAIFVGTGIIKALK
jgi:hypothetical protein